MQEFRKYSICTFLGFFTHLILTQFLDFSMEVSSLSDLILTIPSFIISSLVFNLGQEFLFVCLFADSLVGLLVSFPHQLIPILDYIIYILPYFSASFP